MAAEVNVSHLQIISFWEDAMKEPTADQFSVDIFHLFSSSLQILVFGNEHQFGEKFLSSNQLLIIGEANEVLAVL